MTTEAGLSVKERLAQLQAGNKNPALVGSMKPPPSIKPKPKPPASEPKPAFPVPLRPVTPNKQDTPPPAIFAKLGSVDHVTTNGQDAPHFPKLRPTGTQPGKGVTPLVPQKPSIIPWKCEGAGLADSNVMRGQSDSNSSPRVLSVHERLASLNQKSSDNNSMESKTIENGSDSTSPKTPVSPPTKSPMLPKPNTPAPGVMKPINGPKMDSPPIKPSDIAKSVTSAADRVLRRTQGQGAGGERKSCELSLRNSDGKKFRKVEAASVISSAPAPVKPSRIDNVDLTTFVKAYAAAKEKKLMVDAAKSDLPEEVDGVMDELYVEAESTRVPIQTRGSLKRASSVRVSKIPELTEEEEEELYSDCSSTQAAVQALIPEEVYDACASVVQPQEEQNQPEDTDEIYEPLDELESEIASLETPAEAPPLPSPNLPEDKKAKKEKEKEKETEKEKAGKKHDKGKEEMSKKEEKERKKKEEEIKKQRSKFGLTDADEKVGDGVVKSNAGAGLFTKDLAVTKGEIIAILRMDNNPAGKWLVQNDQGKIGFVCSNNIEVSTPTIRHVMAGAKTESVADEDPEDLYEPLPEGEMDDIYEEM